jgi:hypothetical protein
MRRLRTIADRAANGPTPGSRFCASELGRLLRGGHATLTQERLGGEELLSADELATWLRMRAIDTSALQLYADAPRMVQERPVPAVLLPMMTIVPTSSPQIPVVPEPVQLDDAAWAADGTNLPGTGDVFAPDPSPAATFTVGHLEATRVGRLIKVPLPVLQDPGLAEGVIDRLIARTWARAVEFYALAGNDNANLLGVTDTPGVATLTYSTGTRAESVATALAEVSDNGFIGPLVLACDRRTRNKIWLEKNTAGDDFLRVTEAVGPVTWVPTRAVPTGTAVVLDPVEVVVYVKDGLLVEVSQSVADFLASNMAAVKGEARIATWFRNEGAAVIVDGL